MLQGGVQPVHLRPLLLVRRHMHLGAAGRKDDPEPRSSTEGTEVEAISNALNAFVRENESRTNVR